MSKPGIKTTEFWLTAFKACVGLTLAIGVSLGYLSPEVDAEGIGRHIDKIVSGVVAVVGLFVSGMAVSNYNLGRAQVKSTEVANAPEPVEAEEADAVGFIVQEGDDEDDDDDEDGGVWSGPPSVSLDPEQKYLEVQGAYIAATTVLLELKQQELIEQDRWDEYVQPLIEEGDSLLDDMKVQLDAGNLDRLELLRRSLLRLVVLLQVVEMTG
jgi:hypothetical protein